MRKKQRDRPWAVTVLLWAMVFALTVRGMADSAWALEGEERSSPVSEERMLVPVGRTVGIKLFARGVMVVGLTQVETAGGSLSPAQEWGLKVGDIITALGGQQVNSIEEVQAILQESGGGTLKVEASRGGKNLSLSGQAALSQADGSYKLGAWIRDSMAGIGTVTWYDPATGQFAALGHGVNDVDTGLLMPLQSGSVMPSVVTGLVRGERGEPGALHGSFDLTKDLGRLTANTDWGLFGRLEENCFGGEAVPVAERSQVRTGKATLRTNVEGELVEEFEIEILRVYPPGGKSTQSMMVRVTDPALLEKTGGILQGMSGSPILQNGKLVGAVTHVLIDDPTRGYGIFAEDMLKAGA